MTEPHIQFLQTLKDLRLEPSYGSGLQSKPNPKIKKMVESLLPLRQKIKNALGKGWRVESYTLFYGFRIFDLGDHGGQEYGFKGWFIVELDGSVPVSGLLFDKEIEIVREVIRKYFAERAGTMMRSLFSPFLDIDQKFGAILADPPWSFQAGGNKAVKHQYDCMSLKDIKNMPVAEIVDDDCLLFLWATPPMIPHALETMAAWGFKYTSMLAWAKQSKTGKAWAFGTGYRFRNAAEFMILASKGKPECLSRNTRNLIVSPVREHSRKPDAQYSVVDALAGDVPKIELFARQQWHGSEWHAWGNQTDKFRPEIKLEV